MCLTFLSEYLLLQRLRDIYAFSGFSGKFLKKQKHIFRTRKIFAKADLKNLSSFFPTYLHKFL